MEILKYLLSNLLDFESKRKKYYLELMELEAQGFRHHTELYLENIELVRTIINNLLNMAKELGLLPELKKSVDELVKSKENLILNLGFSDSAVVLALKEKIDYLLRDIGMDYIHVLKYDINKIIFKFLENMINNPYYESI